MKHEIANKVITEAVGGLVDFGFSKLAIDAGFPPAIVALPLVKGLVLGLLENCYNDSAQKTLSVRETQKLNQVSSVALQTFRELAEKDNVRAWEVQVNPEWIDYAFEVAEHATIEAIRQSENAKVDILGRYYGKQLYQGGYSWQDMHQIISMTSALTLRQIVMIHLISSGFDGIDQKLYIANHSACVEVNRLRDYGIWRTHGAAFGIDESRPIRLSELTPTEYSIEVSRELMLDSLSESDIRRTIESLNLTPNAKELKKFTEDDYSQVATKDYVDKSTMSEQDRDSAQFQYDLLRGK